MSRYDPDPQTVPISGIWLRRIGDDLEVLAEIDEEWRVVITEKQDGYMSHIVEVGGILVRDLRSGDERAVMSFLAGEYRAMMKWHREEVDRLRALADEHASRIEELRSVLNGVNGDEDITTFMQDQTRDRRAA